jgi:very-short-patch-repair endonuclease
MLPVAHAARMPGDSDSLRALARTRHGVVSRHEALQAGFSHYAIRHRLDCGMWAGVGRALVIRDLHRPGDRATAWILYCHTGPQSLVSGPVALRLQGWEIPGEDHIVVNPSDVRAAIDLDVRIIRRVSAGYVRPDGHPPLVPRLSALADTVTCRSSRAARDLIDHALQRRWIDATHLERLLDERSGPGRRGQPRLRALHDRAASGSRSEAEQRMRVLLGRTRGHWIANHAVRDEHGQVVAEIDFADPDLGIAIEVDGRAFHSDRRSFERDRVRQNILTLRGWIVLRFTWERIINDPEGVIADILAAMAARAH